MKTKSEYNNKLNIKILKGLVILISTLFSISCAAQENRKPNIVIFVADDLGWNDVGYHGSEIKTPSIDKLASEGMRLNRFYASPVCTPTRGTLLTGRYPDRYGMSTRAFDPVTRDGIPENEETISEMLGKAGYKKRGMVGKWHVGHSNVKFHPLNQGFTSFYGHYLGSVDYFTHKKIWSTNASGFPRTELDWHDGFEPNYDGGYTTDLIRTKAIEFLNQRNEEEPFFLYVAFNAPHTPLQAKYEDLKKYGFNPDQEIIEERNGYGELGRGNTNRQTYSAMVTSMDQAIGRILEALDKKGMTENTIVFFFSDNGATSNKGDNSPLKGEKGDLWEGGIRVPSVVKWPKIIEPGTTSEAVTGAVDLLPTFRQITNIKTKPANALDGISILNILKGGNDDPNRAIFIARDNDRVAVTREWKLFDNNNELYRIDMDPNEQKNVASQHPEIVKSMKNRLRDSGVKHVEKNQGFKVHPEFKMPEN